MILDFNVATKDSRKIQLFFNALNFLSSLIICIHHKNDFHSSSSKRRDMINLVLFIGILSFVAVLFEILMGQLNHHKNIFFMFALSSFVLNLALIGLYGTRDEEDLSYSIALIVFFAMYLFAMLVLFGSTYWIKRKHDAKHLKREREIDAQNVFIEEYKKTHDQTSPTTEHWEIYRKLLAYSLDAYEAYLKRVGRPTIISNKELLKFLRLHIKGYLHEFHHFNYNFDLFFQINFNKLISDVSNIRDFPKAFKEMQQENHSHKNVEPWCVKLYLYLNDFPIKFNTLQYNIGRGINMNSIEPIFPFDVTEIMNLE